MRVHLCHAIGCVAKCPPAHLMCAKHWQLVTPDVRRWVERAFDRRAPKRDETWADWWRAQARAIADVAFVEGRFTDEERSSHLHRADYVARSMEAREGRHPAEKRRRHLSIVRPGKPVGEL